MPKFKDNQPELNRVQSMMSSVDIESRVIPPQPRLVENYMLDKVMTRILWQPKGLETVLNLMQQTEEDFKKYRDTFFLYKLAIPGPLRLMKSIRVRFTENPITEDLFEYLYYDKLELNLCRWIYVINIIWGIASIISIAAAINLQVFWIPLIFIFIWGIIIFGQIKIFEHTIKYILFTKIYKQIVDVIENHYDLHCAYVKRVFEIPQQIEERWQQTQAQMIQDGMNDAEIRNRKRLELETATELQTLGAAIALQQAKDGAEIQQIKNSTELGYLQAELRIKDKELENPKRQHELIRSKIESMGQCLVEKSKVLALDDVEKRKIQHQLHLLNGILSIVQNGDGSPEHISSMYDEFMETEMKYSDRSRDTADEDTNYSSKKKPKSANDA